ncbi:nitroreductase family protein [Carnobacterium divergens]|nr:nitroreductase family protein [Carnobacterium divergens]MDT1940391.1 nitroreductase family protein [Carnobacterium divergens]MDT1942829.1 nitroreductase family protein [Carnobacterium divergens]MDT1948635.1 nitroreductase family protein [Carnobacterium divergens]MDT1951116.1 nitroreductase family protein [Carnobacterium divergens]MDT1956174.1 nitroreductase family protein [Carnobacterium divergens]
MSEKMLTNDFNTILAGRRSIRNYDPAVKISKEEMNAILTEATLAPSSVNMQPWRFVVVESDEGKATLKPIIRFNTLQNDTSSAMILIFGDRNCFDFGEEIYGTAVERGLMPQEVKDRQIAALTNHYNTISDDKLKEILLIDGGIVAMQLMLVARKYGYDTNPIGGFEEDQLAEAFGLDANRYVPVMVLSIGKANEEGYASVRLPIEKITEWK